MQAEIEEACLFVMSHEVDMQNPVCWLRRSRTPTGPRFVVPSGHGDVNVIRQVLQPFNIECTKRASRQDLETQDVGQAAKEPIRYTHLQVLLYLWIQATACLMYSRNECSGNKS
jgi:hypothetical protein